MFITSKRAGYDRHGEQVASGLFLMLVQPKNFYDLTCNDCAHQFTHIAITYCPKCGSSHLNVGRFLSFQDANNAPIRAIVRRVSLRQLGHFMMGFARVGKHRLTVSGAYGADGLVMSVPSDVYERGVELPKTLKDAWSNGGGWNSAGSEADAMREWALENLAELRK